MGQPYFDWTAFARVTDARFGSAGFNSLRGPGAFNSDLGLFRRFAMTEKWIWNSGPKRSTGRIRRNSTIRAAILTACSSIPTAVSEPASSR